MSNTIRIKSAKIVDDKFLEATLIEGKVVDDKSCKQNEVHPDLKLAFDALHSHLAILCGYVLTEDVEDIKTGKIENFVVRGYSIGKNENGVTLTGHHINPFGKAVILNSPFTLFEQEDETAYEFIDDLKDKLQRAESEVRKYLFEDKKANDPQGNLFADQQGNLKEKEAVGAE